MAYVYAWVEIPFVTLTSTGWNVTPIQLSIETSSYCLRFQPEPPREIEKKGGGAEGNTAKKKRETSKENKW